MPKLKTSLEWFQEIIRIPTISALGPNGAYKECADWLKNYTEDAGLECKIISPIADKPIVIATWKGTDPSLPSILLNSHYDVVPVMPEHWTDDPFSGVITEDGYVYGRGTQDMKCVCVQYIEAIKKLKQMKFIPSRTTYLTFVPDEEIGGKDGLGALIKLPEFEAMRPIALALDEGLASTNEVYKAYYGERLSWSVIFTATGPTGHGSQFIKNTATSKIMKICDKVLQYREKEERRMKDMNLRMGDVTTSNLTILKSGITQDNGKTYAINVVPGKAEAGFDIRISPNVNTSDFIAMLDEWAKECDVEWKQPSYKSSKRNHYLSSPEDPNWKKVLDVFQQINIQVETEIFPAATDSRYLREAGIPAFGFSPMIHTKLLLHEHNEKLHKDTFLKGIDIYSKILERLLTAS